MKPATEAVVQRLMSVFGMPPHIDEDSLPVFLAEFARALDRFDGKTLAAVADRSIRVHKFWPRPAELVEHAESLQSTGVALDDSPRQRAQRERREAVDREADRYMTSCRSSLIDMALRQGWSRSLQDLACDVIRRCWDRDGEPPSLAMLERFRLPEVDVAYYARHGQPHTQSRVDELLAARAQTRAAADYTVRMMGEGDRR